MLNDSICTTAGSYLAILPFPVSSAINGTSLGQRVVVLVDGGDEVVGGHLSLRWKSDGTAKHLAEVAVVLNRESLAPAQPDMPEIGRQADGLECRGYFVVSCQLSPTTFCS